MKKWIKCLMAILLAEIMLATAACSSVAPAQVVKLGAKGTHQQVQLTAKQADGYIIPIGKANIVCAITDVGMVGCGAFDVMALDAYAYPAVKVKSSSGGSIATIDDLLAGTVKEVNNEAAKLGIKTGMTGREALDHM
jgi:uncharacterized protein YunC (DUF1805 family)